jgi:dienelactone hydrolase
MSGLTPQHERNSMTPVQNRKSNHAAGADPQVGAGSGVSPASGFDPASSGSTPSGLRAPRLVIRTADGRGDVAPTGIVLILHGGQVSSTEPVRPWNLALARMRLLIAPVLERGASADVAVAVLRYRHRGWNGEAADAHADADWALGELARRYGPVPVSLIGHSMGARAALLAGGHPSVAGIAALAPWAPDGEPVAQLAGRTVLIAHGSRDRVIAPAQSAGYARRAAAAGARVCRLRVDGSGHAMLGRLADWNLLAAGFALACVGVGSMPLPVSEALACGPADLDTPLAPQWWRTDRFTRY